MFHPVKHNYWPICKSVLSLEPVVVNVVSVHVCRRFHVVKSVLCHQHVSPLAKPLFMTVDTVTNTLNVCKVLKYIGPTRDTSKVFPSTHNSISIFRHICCLHTDNIANSHLLLINFLSSSKTQSPSSLTLNINFPEWTFSLPEISSSQIFHHVSSSGKFCFSSSPLLFMVLFNSLLLHQPIQNVLIFNILADFTLFLLVCLKFYYKTCDTITFYIKQHKTSHCFYLIRF